MNGYIHVSNINIAFLYILSSFQCSFFAYGVTFYLCRINRYFHKWTEALQIGSMYDGYFF